MSTAQIVATTEPQDHLLQFYQSDPRSLAIKVSDYLFGGLSQGEGVLVVTTPDHLDAFQRQLAHRGLDLPTIARDGRAVVLDAKRTLGEFMSDSGPDWTRFEKAISAAIRCLRKVSQGIRVRAYGDMVGVLWESGDHAAAILLEEFWNRILRSLDFSLYCAYPIDVFGGSGGGSQTEAVERLLCAHSHFVPVGQNGDLEGALDRAVRDVLGPEHHSFEHRNGRPGWAVMPKAEAAIFALRANAPSAVAANSADDILTRAREYYQAEKRFRALVENSFDGISLSDPHGKIVYASASNARILGYQPDELTGRNALDLAHPDDVECVTRMIAGLLAKPDCPVRVEVRLLRKDGEWCWVENTSTNLLDEPDVRAIVSNYRDISDRKAAELRIQQHADQLARSNAELQAFAYAAAHDLKEPLRTVCAFTQLLAQKTPMDADTSQVAGFIVDGVSRMSTLLDDLLSFTSLDFSAPASDVDLRKVVEQALRNLERAISESGANIRVDSLPVAWGNENHLVQVFQNLLANAIKYRSEMAPEIHVTAVPVGRECVVKIKDNGIGIAPLYHERVFGLFKRLHARDIPGTGIGLAICKKVVEASGGRIWVESALGEGSTFCFTIPLHSS